MGQNPSFAEAEKQIAEALSRLRYGSLLITIHDSRVVQIEVSEKLRFNPRGELINDSSS